MALPVDVRKTASFGAACGVGSLIGAVVALEIFPHMLPQHVQLLAGAVLGGIAAAIIGEFRNICHGLRRIIQKIRGLSPIYVSLLRWSLAAAATASTTGTLVVAMAGHNVPFLWDDANHLSFAVGWAVSTVAASAFAMSHPEAMRNWDNYDRADWYKKMCRWVIAICNPVALPICVIVAIAAMVCWLLWLMMSALVMKLLAMPTWLKNTFIEVSADRFKLLFIYGFLGAAVGTFHESAALGLFAGGILGMFHFYVISIRWLQIAVR